MKCPLLPHIKQGVAFTTIPILRECLKTDCAWWENFDELGGDKEDGQCVIKSIADLISDLNVKVIL